MASLITFRGLWAAAGIIPPPPPPTVVSDEEVDGQEGKDAKTAVKRAESYAVDSDMGVSESASSYVEVKGTD